MRFVIFLILIALLAAAPASAQSTTGVAKYAGEFMATGFGGRALAMGGAFAAVANDVTAAYWNPAGLMQLSYPEIGLMYEQRFGGLLNYNYGGVAWPVSATNTLAFSMTRMGIDDIPDTRSAFIDLNGNGVMDDTERPDYSRITYFNSSDWVAYMTYATRASDDLSLGVNLKAVLRSLGDVGSAWGFGFDVGALYRVSPELTLGANLQDVTTTLVAWSTGTNDLVSPTAKIGAAYRFEVLGGTLLPALDIDIMGENRQYASLASLGPVSLAPRAGVEFQYRDLFAVRGGYSDTQNFTVGAGVKLPKLYLDYAFGQSPLSGDFKDATHRISIRLTLEEKKFLRASN